MKKQQKKQVGNLKLGDVFYTGGGALKHTVTSAEGGMYVRSSYVPVLPPKTTHHFRDEFVFVDEVEVKGASRSLKWLRFDGWGVPDPTDQSIDDAIWRCIYGTPTKSDLYDVVSLAQVFLHLATHPQGTEACIKQLRQIRNRLKEVDQ